MARKVLDADEMADKKQLKKAYPRVTMKFHPNKNLKDPDANKKCVLIRFAYKLLTEDKPCPALLEEINSLTDAPENNKYRLDNPWGHFLWWREKYFDSEKEKNSNGKRSSCI